MENKITLKYGNDNINNNIILRNNESINNKAIIKKEYNIEYTVEDFGYDAPSVNTGGTIVFDDSGTMYYCEQDTSTIYYFTGSGWQTFTSGTISRIFHFDFYNGYFYCAGVNNGIYEVDIGGNASLILSGDYINTNVIDGLLWVGSDPGVIKSYNGTSFTDEIDIGDRVQFDGNRRKNYNPNIIVAGSRLTSQELFFKLSGTWNSYTTNESRCICYSTKYDAIFVGGENEYYIRKYDTSGNLLKAYSISQNYVQKVFEFNNDIFATIDGTYELLLLNEKTDEFEILYTFPTLPQWHLQGQYEYNDKIYLSDATGKIHVISYKII